MTQRTGEQLRHELDNTRERLGETMSGIADKVEVPERTKHAAQEAKRDLQHAGATAKREAKIAADTARHEAKIAAEAAKREAKIAKQTAKREAERAAKNVDPKQLSMVAVVVALIVAVLVFLRFKRSSEDAEQN